jgi:tetratricopeptide (TPR) repeat protein
LDLYNIDPMINRARVYVKLGKYELAKQDIDRILRLDPQSQAALLLRFTVDLFICNRESTCSDASVMVVNLLDMVNKLESNTDV